MKISTFRYFATKANNVLSIDHWQGSIEHQKSVKLQTLYSQFMSNCVQFKHIILPIKMSTYDAAQLELPKADLIYIDASHETDDVIQDIENYYPLLKTNGILCGDDWNWRKDRPVQKAVKYYAKNTI